MFENFAALNNRICTVIGCNIFLDAEIYVNSICIFGNSTVIEVAVRFNKLNLPDNLKETGHDTLRFDLDILNGNLSVSPHSSSDTRGQIEIFKKNEIWVAIGGHSYHFYGEKINFSNFRTNCYQKLVDSNWTSKGHSFSK